MKFTEEQIVQALSSFEDLFAVMDKIEQRLINEGKLEIVNNKYIWLKQEVKDAKD